jgi:hypothetical protein
MSHVHVERAIGMLATDEAIRRRFAANARVALDDMARIGVELNECERWALAHLDPKALERFAVSMDPRLQKMDPRGDQR